MVEKKHWITNGAELIQSGDLFRILDDEGVFSEWQSADHHAGSRVDSFAQWYGMGIQFARVAEPVPEPEWEPLPIEDDTVLQPGRDEVRLRYSPGNGWSAWSAIAGEPQLVKEFVAERPSDFEFEFRRRRNWTPAPEQPPAPTTDRGERYRRTITQSLPGDTNGLSITVDIADICEAFSLPYMLAQAAKKIMLPGERGSKDRLKDLREAAWHIQRQIQIEEARQQEQADL